MYARFVAEARTRERAGSSTHIPTAVCARVFFFILRLLHFTTAAARDSPDADVEVIVIVIAIVSYRTQSNSGGLFFFFLFGSPKGHKPHAAGKVSNHKKQGSCITRTIPTIDLFLYVLCLKNVCM